MYQLLDDACQRLATFNFDIPVVRLKEAMLPHTLTVVVRPIPPIFSGRVVIAGHLHIARLESDSMNFEQTEREAVDLMLQNCISYRQNPQSVFLLKLSRGIEQYELMINTEIEVDLPELPNRTPVAIRCARCGNEIDRHDPHSRLHSCGHIFHDRCLQEHLNPFERKHRRYTCPHCHTLFALIPHSDPQDECAVCREPLGDESERTVTLCNHAFHRQCLIRWCTMSPPGSCPSCRDRKNHRFSYCIFTPGSISKPKGILIKHKSVQNQIQALNHVNWVNMNNTMIHIAPCSSDTHLSKIYGCFYYGAQLICLHPQDLLDLDYLSTTIQNHQVSHIDVVPQYASSLYRFWEQKEKFKDHQFHKYDHFHLQVTQ
ncbi:unnamed protein product [Didymodactylos carnosus]|uniref:RING-type domain-containing protein n=1 Tax=Didymodactylos carnosus TaxID=1234261 RepID=A0A814CCL8_9BILA|nr:unnamed protein product [Didymodactylos carnosus]CAF1220392.1 unnamed protein product [Didymodactylos carnosus]CAF3715740.1 unnamed protein product [Didymodactylos carnosus]CAF4028420.1 unnamed protein product [Didymodactylos carnosus]